MFDLSNISTELMKLMAAVVLVLIGFIIGKITGRIVTLLFIEYDAARIFRRFGGTKVAFFLGGFTSYTIYFFTILIILNQFGIRAFTGSILAFLIILVVLASVVLGTRDFFENLLAHFTQKSQFRKGDVVVFSGIKGRVVQSDLVKIKVVSSSGDVFILPNAGLFDMHLKKIR